MDAFEVVVTPRIVMIPQHLVAVAFESNGPVPGPFLVLDVPRRRLNTCVPGKITRCPVVDIIRFPPGVVASQLEMKLRV